MEKEIKKLMKSQKEFIKSKYERLVFADAELKAAVKIVATELGIPENEKWELDQDMEQFDKVA